MPKNKNSVDCLGLGIAPLDFLFTSPNFPGAGQKIDATELVIQGGGPVPNCLVGLSRLGLTTAFVGAFGGDVTGKLGIDELKHDGVETRYVVLKKQPSALASGLIEQGSGRRTIATYRKIVKLPSELDLSSLHEAKIIHL